MNNVPRSVREAAVESMVFASTNHVMGMYEKEYAPGIYSRKHGLLLDHTDPVRPGSFYAASKVFGEDLGRFYVEEYEYPEWFYVLRIGSVRPPEQDHPYGIAEQKVEEGEVKRGDEVYERLVRRLRATWQSRRDFTHQVECCLRDDFVRYGILNGVSDNDRRWFDLEHARNRICHRSWGNGEDCAALAA